MISADRSVEDVPDGGVDLAGHWTVLVTGSC